MKWNLKAVGLRYGKSFSLLTKKRKSNGTLNMQKKKLDTKVFSNKLIKGEVTTRLEKLTLSA